MTTEDKSIEWRKFFFANIPKQKHDCLGKIITCAIFIRKLKFPRDRNVAVTMIELKT